MYTLAKQAVSPRPPMIAAGIDGNLMPSPINPAWIISGNPEARNAVLSRSDDSMAFTMLWDCTAGEFDWHYSFEETIHFIEGSAVISDGHSPPRRFGAGDVLFLPYGAVAHWHVETYVRKVAFCRYAQPRLVNLWMRAARKSKRVFGRLAAVGGVHGGLYIGTACDNAWIATL